MDSILTTVKKMLGIEEEYEHFDIDIIVLINAAIATLIQLGVGPHSDFSITGKEETWDDFIGPYPNLEPVKTYVYLKVRSIFDPPQSGAGVEAVSKAISELEWRLNVTSDEQKNPIPKECNCNE